MTTVEFRGFEEPKRFTDLYPGEYFVFSIGQLVYIKTDNNHAATPIPINTPPGQALSVYVPGTGLRFYTGQFPVSANPEVFGPPETNNPTTFYSSNSSLPTIVPGDPELNWNFGNHPGIPASHFQYALSATAIDSSHVSLSWTYPTYITEDVPYPKRVLYLQRSDRRYQMPKINAAFNNTPFANTAANFTVPAVGGSVAVTVNTSGWAAIGSAQVVYIVSAGYYQVAGVIDGTHVTLTNLGLSGNAVPTTVIASPKNISYGPSTNNRADANFYARTGTSEAPGHIIHDKGSVSCVGDGPGAGDSYWQCDVGTICTNSYGTIASWDNDITPWPDAGTPYIDTLPNPGSVYGYRLIGLFLDPLEFPTYPDRDELDWNVVIAVSEYHLGAVNINGSNSITWTAPDPAILTQMPPQPICP